MGLGRRDRDREWGGEGDIKDRGWGGDREGGRREAESAGFYSNGS